MGAPIINSPCRLPAEPDAHVMMRRLLVLTRLLFAFFLIATVLLLVFYRPAAHLAAIPIPVLGFVLIIVNYLEQRSRASVLRVPGQERVSAREAEVDVRDAGIAMGLEIAGVMAFSTFAIAALFFDITTLGFGATLTLLVAIWYGIPYWGLFVTEAMREERERVCRYCGDSHDTETCTRWDDRQAVGSITREQINEMTHWEDDGGGNVGADYEWLIPLGQWAPFETNLSVQKATPQNDRTSAHPVEPRRKDGT